MGIVRETTFKIILVLNLYCTVTSVNGLIGGREPKLNEVKYQVAILSSTNGICGGGIIGDRHIITAAHCLKVDEKSNILKPTRIITSTNATDNYNPKVSIIKYVRRAFVPASYVPNVNTASDIAVLELTGSLQVEKHSDRLQKLFLPERVRSGPEVYTDYNNLNVFFAGYGRNKVQKEVAKNGTIIHKTSGAGRLHVANATITNWESCRKGYGATMNYRMCVKIHESVGKYGGVCFGDSGSPIVLNGKVVLGVSSAVSAECANKLPSIFVRTSSFLKFIKDAMNGIVTEDMKVYKHV